MLDKAIFTIIRTLLLAGFARQGLTNIKCEMLYQPTLEGVNTGPAVYFAKLGPDIALGWPDRGGNNGTGAAVFTGSISNTILTISAVTSGSLAPYQEIDGVGINDGTIILSQLTGAMGGIGTYQLNQSPLSTIASEAMTSEGVYAYWETQQVTSSFQLTALSIQNPSNANQLTASDIANLARQIMQSAQTITSLESQGMGIFKIAQVRNPQFVDDRQQYEASPSFDFTISHKQTIITTIANTSEVDAAIYEV